MDDRQKYKLQKIDMILNDESEFEKYINELENTKVSYSNKLEDKILLNIKSKKNKHYLNICKMVACAVLALILCQTDYIKGSDYSYERNVKIEISESNTFINDKINEISNFFMKPINIEKGEK